VIRGARREDAAAIAAVEVRAFRHAYGDVLDAHFLAELDPGERADVWEGVLADVEQHVVVAEHGERVVGYAVLCGADLRALYVDPFAQGAGVGTQLLAEAERAGARSLEVFAATGHARRFYEARGWRFDGESGAWLDRPLVKYLRG
jgi:GNAT superfamily N-acetyltransferase